MRNPLAANIVHAVCREVLVARAPLLDTVIDILAEQLTPVIREEAFVLLAESFGQTANGDIIIMLLAELERAAVTLSVLESHVPEGAFAARLKTDFADLLAHWGQLTEYCRERCPGLPEDLILASASPAEEGGQS